MLIEELRRELGGAEVPFDPRLHAQAYRSEPKVIRRILNALVRAGGVMDFETLAARMGSTREILRRLQERGLAYALPSPERPERVVLPLEHLFATPLLENDLDKLLEALRFYPKEALWAIASKAGLPVEGVDECRLRARLFRHATSGMPFDSLRAPEIEVLKILRSSGWAADVGDLYTKVQLRGESPASAGELLTSAAVARTPLGGLLHRMLLIPLRLGPQTGVFRSLAIPRELRAGVEEALGKATPVLRAVPCLADRNPQYVSLEGRVRGELLRYLLLIENDPPAVTQRRTINRRDLGRIARRAGLDEATTLRMDTAAVRLGLLAVSKGRAVVGPDAEAVLSNSPSGFARAAAERFTGTQLIPMGDLWIDEAQASKLSKAARRTLLETLSGPGTTACMHCVSKRLADTAEAREVLGLRPKAVPMIAAWYAEGFARAFYEMGFAEAEVGGNEVRSLRWTATGAAALGKTPVPSGESPEPGTITIQPSGEIIAPTSLPLGELRRLARAAEVRSVDAVAVFALTRQALVRAAQRGEDPAALKKLLVSRSHDPLPQPVAFLLDEVAARMGEVEVVPCAAVVRVRDPMILKMLGSRVTPVSETLGILSPGGDPEGLIEELRRKGYLPRPVRRPEPPVPREIVQGSEGRGEPPPPARAGHGPDGRCGCEREVTTVSGIQERVEHALQTDDPIQILVRGGRSERVVVLDLEGDRVEAYNLDTERDVVVSLSSIIAARVVPE